MSLWSLIIQTDIISKIVMLFLLALSFVTWVAGVYKMNILKLKTKQLKAAQPLLFHISMLDDLIGRAATVRNTFAGELLAHYLTELKKCGTNAKVDQHASRHHAGHSYMPKQLSRFDYEGLVKNIEHTAVHALEAEENVAPLFSTIAQIAPLLGLFGTVWGLIHSFMSIAQLQQVDIATIAPGISEALLTTLAGLLVAVPALVLFNMVLNRIRLFEQQVIALTQLFLDTIRAILVVNDLQGSGSGNTQFDYQKLFDPGHTEKIPAGQSDIGAPVKVNSSHTESSQQKEL